MGADDDGWTQVARKGPPGSRRVQRTTHADNVPGAQDLRPNPDATFTLDDLRKYHDGIRKEWLASDCCRDLVELLTKGMSGRAEVTTAICLGPGSFDPVTGSWAGRRAAHMQVEAFRTLTSILGVPESARIVQEPVFTATDKALCAELGLVVSDATDASGLVDAKTAVFGIHMYIQIWHATLCKQLPALFVGTGLQSWEDRRSFEPELDDLLGPIAKMDADFDRFEFPDLGIVFSGTCVYWRKAAEEGLEAAMKALEIDEGKEAVGGDKSTNDEDKPV